MRRRRLDILDEVKVDLDAVPEALVAGACFEVWASEVVVEQVGTGGGFDGRYWIARRRYRDARDRFLSSLEVSPWSATAQVPASLRDAGFRSPWSYELLRIHDPQRLAERLRRLGLPARWQPTPAPRLDTFGPSTITSTTYMNRVGADRRLHEHPDPR